MLSALQIGQLKSILNKIVPQILKLKNFIDYKVSTLSYVKIIKKKSGKERIYKKNRLNARTNFLDVTAFFLKIKWQSEKIIFIYPLYLHRENIK